MNVALRLVGASALLAAGVIAAGPSLIRAATAEATMYPCAGVPADAPVKEYPEPRDYLEQQVWVEPQPMHAGYVGSGQQGHIHVGTCFPQGHHLTGKTLPLDVLVQAHNMSSPVGYGLRVDAYDVLAWWDHRSGGPPVCIDGTAEATGTCFKSMDCKVEQCEQWVHADFPLAAVPVSGNRQFYVFVQATNELSTQRGYGRWNAYVDNGKPACSDPAGTGCRIGQDDDLFSGEGWYGGDPSIGGKYARAQIPKAEFLQTWDPQSGQLNPLSGTWTIHPSEEGQRLQVLIDPKLHAHPIDRGVVAHDSVDLTASYRSATVAIDTTKLTDGLHYLLVAAGKVGKAQTWWGVMKIPFLVDNDTAPPTTTTTTTTTTTMPMPMYHPACEPTCDEQISDLRDRIARARSALEGS